MTDVKLSLLLLTAPFVLMAAFGELGHDFSLYRHIHHYGTPAVAVVQRIEPASYMAYPEGGRMLTYTLDLPGPAFINGAVHMSDHAATRYSPGQEIGIVYSASDPSLHALSVGYAWFAFLNSALVVAAYGAVLALAIALMRTSPRRSWRDDA
ncbi:MAG: hypothetical protein J0H65_03785 [Rhizobiales bacterium]|nr:hypothetical protein [Hyphomicrobiales bacterium]